MATVRQDLITYIPEPQSFRDLLLMLSTENNFSPDLFGDATDFRHRHTAAQILNNHPRKRIIGTLVHGRVGGIVFDPFHEQSVQQVIDIKSQGGRQRQALFALIADLPTVMSLVDVSHMQGMSLADLRGECFIQLPLRSSALPHLPYVTQQSQGELTMGQFFIPKPGTTFADVVDMATTGKRIKILAGTSANYTGQESITHKLAAADFCLQHNIYWLDEPGDMRRGSYAIVQIAYRQMTEMRSGNVSYLELQQRVGI